MSLRNKNNSDNNWMSFSDIMTGLMVIFMFIAISYMIQAEKDRKANQDFVESYFVIKERLFNELNNEFKSDFKKWKVEIDEDLSIKFTNPDILFKSGSKKLRNEFKVILNDFLPRYFDIILDSKFVDHISEVRIEGHTDPSPDWREDSDPYMGNVKLSQQRSTQVLKYFRAMNYFRQLSNNSENMLTYWLTANGLSFGRTLDANKELTFISGKAVDYDLSRRVEFRIVTKSEGILKTLKRKMQ